MKLKVGDTVVLSPKGIKLGFGRDIPTLPVNQVKMRVTRIDEKIIFNNPDDQVIEVDNPLINTHMLLASDFTKVESHMADRIEDKDEKIKQAATLLLEARDALPAISLASARLHQLDLTLADRIEDWLKPWKTS